MIRKHLRSNSVFGVAAIVFFSCASVPKSSAERCAIGETNACVEEARSLLLTAAGVNDEEKAVGMLERACAKGNASGCLRLAQAFDFGLGGAKRPTEAEHMYTQLCAQGHREACAFAERFAKLREALGRHTCPNADAGATVALPQSVQVVAGAAGDGGNSAMGGLALNDTSARDGGTAPIGALAKSDIRTVISIISPRFAFFYSRAMARTQAFSGKWTVRFRIAPDGTVSEVSTLASDLSDARFAEELTGEVRQLRFPCPRGGGVVQVDYPFVFNVRGT